MFSIGICDDEKMHREHIRELCERFFAEYPQQHELIEFSSGEEVLAYQGDRLHLLFLDIELGGMDGIEVLRSVEEADWIWRIVFVSSHDEAVWDTFGIRTLGFARKPVEYPQIEKWIRAAIRENKENVMLEYTIGTQKCYKTLEDVYYLEAAGNYTYLYEKNERVLINDNLKQWQKKMEQMPMVRIHKSYIINMQHVQKWEADKVRLTNKTELAVGRKYAKEANAIHTAYVKKQTLGRS